MILIVFAFSLFLGVILINMAISSKFEQLVDLTSPVFYIFWSVLIATIVLLTLLIIKHSPTDTEKRANKYIKSPKKVHKPSKSIKGGLKLEFHGIKQSYKSSKNDSKIKYVDEGKSIKFVSLLKKQLETVSGSEVFTLIDSICLSV